MHLFANDIIISRYILIRKRRSEGNCDLSWKETDDDKMKYRFLINYTECTGREETKKKKKEENERKL